MRPTTQPHNHTITQPHNHTSHKLNNTIPLQICLHSWSTMAHQKDLEHLERTLSASNLRSRRYERNIVNAIRRCQNPRETRRSILDFWACTSDVSFETCVLCVSAFGYDSFTRRTSSLPLLLSKLKETEFQARIRCHPVLTEWAGRLQKQGRIVSTIRKDCWLTACKASKFLVC